MSVSNARYVLGRFARVVALLLFAVLFLWNVLSGTRGGYYLVGGLTAWVLIVAYVGKWLLYPSEDDDTDDDSEPYDFPNLP